MPALRHLLVLALLALFGCAHAADEPGDSVEAPWRVLILNGADVLIPFWQLIDPVLRESMAAEAAPRKVEFRGEALDLARFPNVEAEVVALLKKKYWEQPVDLVLTVGTSALQFAKKYQASIWRGAPIVFLVVPAGDLDDQSRSLNVTGVFYDFDIDGTLALISRLQPRRNRLLVIGGNSTLDLAWNAHFVPHHEHVPKDVAIEYVNELTPDELVPLLGGLPPTTAVLYTSMSRDARGASHTPRDIAGQLAQASAAPVYAMFPTMLGQGIVGGSMAAIEDEGAAAAKLAVRVLRAGSAEAIPAQASPPARCVLDMRALRRWDIDQDAVPDDCEIRFLPRVIWRDYPRQFAASMATIVTLALLVAALLVQRRRRHQADLAVQSLRVTLFHASRLAAVGELTASIAHEINQPLGAILANADAARRIIERDPSRTEDLQQILGDIRADDLRASAVIRRIRGILAKREPERERVRINEVVDEVLALLRNEATRRSITLNAALDPAAPDVLGDRVQLQQTLVNLLINAMDAMVETAGPQRIVDVTTAATEDGNAEMAVADRGHGIAAENLPRLFDSFWSTKPAGMGLGLAISKSILEAHGGTIRAERNGYGGATFRITLPAARSAAADATGYTLRGTAA
jgi:signal transduction histidine kinase